MVDDNLAEKAVSISSPAALTSPFSFELLPIGTTKVGFQGLRYFTDDFSTPYQHHGYISYYRKLAHQSLHDTRYFLMTGLEADLEVLWLADSTYAITNFASSSSKPATFTASEMLE